jgi:hypothetical protein
VSAILLASLAPSEPTSLPCAGGAAAISPRVGETQRPAEAHVTP